MKKIFRFSAIALCVAMLLATVLPARAETKFFDLSVSTVTVAAGERVCFAVDIAENPGIMAMTVTFHYDPDVLQFVAYVPGIIAKDTVVDHPDRGYVSIVWCGSPKRNPDGTISDHPDVEENGTLFGMEFDVAETATAGNYPVTVKKIRPSEPGDSLLGSFANWEKDSLKPTVFAGELILPAEEIICTEHQFSDWQTDVADAQGEKNGREKRICTVCGYCEWREVAPKKQKDSSETVSDVLEEPTVSQPTDNETELTVSDPLEPAADAQGEGGNRHPPEIVPSDSAETDDTDFVTAEQLIEKAKQSASHLKRIFVYLFGSTQQRGLCQVLWQFFKSVFV